MKNHDSDDDIVGTVSILSELMEVRRDTIDREILKQGLDFLGLFIDDNFGPDFKNVRSEFQLLWGEVVTDISGGAVLLSKNTMGLTFHLGTIKRFNVPYGSSVEGTVVLKFSLKSAGVGGSKQKSGEPEVALSQEDINSAVYFLAHMKAYLKDYFTKGLGWF